MSDRDDVAYDALLDQGVSPKEASALIQQRRQQEDEANGQTPHQARARRTKTSRRKQSKIVMAAQSVVRTIAPGNSDDAQLNELWLALEEDVVEAFKGNKSEDEVKRAVHRYFRRLFRNADDQERIRQLISSRLRKDARAILRKCVDERYQDFFEPPELSLPNQILIPSPFRRQARGREAMFGPSNPLTLHYGDDITLHIFGVAPHAEDQALMFALNQIRKRSLARRSEIGVTFKTTLVEIGREMRNNNAWQATAKNAIRRGLRRLRACTFDLFPRI